MLLLKTVPNLSYSSCSCPNQIKDREHEVVPAPERQSHPIRRLRDPSQLITIQSLHHLTQALMTIIVVVPHLLVVLDLFLVIERQTHEAIYAFGEMDYPRRVLSLHLEHQELRLIRNHLCRNCFGRSEGRWYP